MKKSFVAAIAGMLAGATLLLSTGPALAQPRIGLDVSVGVPIAPVAVAPAPVVYGAYGPVMAAGAPYFYRGRGWHDFHGYRGYHGWHR